MDFSLLRGTVSAITARILLSGRRKAKIREDLPRASTPNTLEITAKPTIAKLLL